MDFVRDLRIGDRPRRAQNISRADFAVASLWLLREESIEEDGRDGLGV